MEPGTETEVDAAERVRHAHDPPRAPRRGERRSRGRRRLRAGTGCSGASRTARRSGRSTARGPWPAPPRRQARPGRRACRRGTGLPRAPAERAVRHGVVDVEGRGAQVPGAHVEQEPRPVRGRAPPRRAPAGARRPRGTPRAYPADASSRQGPPGSTIASKPPRSDPGSTTSKSAATRAACSPRPGRRPRRRTASRPRFADGSPSRP